MPAKAKSRSTVMQAGNVSTTSTPSCEERRLPMSSAIAASALPNSGEISSVRSLTCGNSTPAQKSSATLPEDSTGNERDCSPYLERLQRGDKLTLVVAHRDRLARFGFELIQWLVQQNGGEILVLNQQDASPESELTEDLLAILHTFSCRMPGLRRYRTAIASDKDLSQLPAEGNDTDLAGRQPVELQPGGGDSSVKTYRQ